MLGLVFPMAAVGSLVPRTSVAGQAASRSEAASKFLEVKGGKLHYVEWGASNTKPLLLLHPAPLNAHVWDEFGPTMARYYRVVAPDARGFGESSWSDAYTDDGFLEDIRALVTALGLKQLTLCGNSMGGTLAYYYASLYPDEVDRLIVVEAGPTGEKPPEAGAPVAPTGSPRLGGPPPVPTGPFMSRDAAAARVPAVYGAAFARFMVEHNLKQDAAQWQWQCDQGPAVAVAFEQSIRDLRRWPRWLAVKCPTLVLRGERSPVLTQRNAEQMVSENKNATLVVVPNAGHFIPIEQPAAFEAVVRKWLGLTA